MSQISLTHFCHISRTSVSNQSLRRLKPFHTRLRHVWDTSKTRLRHVWHVWPKSHRGITRISPTFHTCLTHILHTSYTRLAHVLHTSCPRLIHISHISRTRLTHVSHISHGSHTAYTPFWHRSQTAQTHLTHASFRSYTCLTYKCKTCIIHVWDKSHMLHIYFTVSNMSNMSRTRFSHFVHDSPTSHFPHMSCIHLKRQTHVSDLSPTRLSPSLEGGWVRPFDRWPWWQGYESSSLVLYLAVLQSISQLCITYRESSKASFSHTMPCVGKSVGWGFLLLISYIDITAMI